MVEERLGAVPAEGVMVDIGEEVGALLVWATEELLGREIEVSPSEADGRRVHAVIHERRTGGRPVFAALFPSLPEGEYDLWATGNERVARVTIAGSRVREVDWQNRPPRVR